MGFEPLCALESLHQLRSELSDCCFQISAGDGLFIWDVAQIRRWQFHYDMIARRWLGHRLALPAAV
jgi:hypothetical protein